MARRMCGPLTGPLVPYVERFRESLAEQGYSSHSVRSHVLLMGHVSRVARQRGLCGQPDLSGERARLFLGTRQGTGVYVHPASMARMTPLLDYLGDIRREARPCAVVPSSQRWGCSSVVSRAT